MSIDATNCWPRIVLVGAGHAHLEVLKAWSEKFPHGCFVTVIEPKDAVRYSGMLPGWIAGRCDESEFAVFVTSVAAPIGATTLKTTVTGIDRARGKAICADGSELDYDVLSIATGGVGRAHSMLGDDPRLIDIRPIDHFMEVWAQRAGSARNIAIVGGGAGGVEVAFGIRNAADAADAKEVTLITGKAGLLPNHSAMVRRKVERELARQDLQMITADARFENGALVCDGLEQDRFDTVIAAIGSAAPPWLADTGLALDADGFISVNVHQQSISHPNIFAAGDVAQRMDRHVPHAGVHAVYAGPILAHNLQVAAEMPGTLREYRPKGRNLFLLSTSRGEAILSWGPIALQGRWLQRLKDWIDRRWIAQFRK